MQRNTFHSTRMVLLLLLMLVVSGCTYLYTYSETLQLYQDAPVSYKAINEFNFEPLPTGGSTGYDLNEKSPAYNFLTGKSFFKSFVLPQDNYPYLVTVRSCLLGTQDAGYIFYPQIITLNEAYEQVRLSTPMSFNLKMRSFADTGWSPLCLYYIQMTLAFTEENKTEKYLVILTTSELLKAKSTLSAWRATPIILPGIVGVISIGKRERLVSHSPFGKIEVSLERQKSQ